MKQKMMVVIVCFTILFSFFAVNVYAGPTLTANATGTFEGYDYEYWKDNGTGTMTLNGGGSFSCSWSNINNILFRTGKKLGSTKTYKEYGNIVMEYACNYQPNGNSYMSVYGWTKEPLVEYYIIDSYGTWKPPGNQYQPKGTISVDGGTYEIYETTRTQQPSIIGTATFQQYWSIRTVKRTSGTITVSDHFKAWEAKGMKMGKLYEVSMVVEGYQSSGKADMTKMNITMGGSTPSVPPSNTPTRLPVNTPTNRPSNPPTYAPAGDCGDCNSDGLVNSTDYSALKQHILSVRTISGTALKNADTDLDGNVNSTDLTILRRYILGIIKSLPYGSTPSSPSPRPTDPIVQPSSPTVPLSSLPSFQQLQSNAKLPDPFKFLNGTRMTSASQWPQRRAEISALAQKFEFGEKPEKPDSVTGSFSGNKITVTVKEGSKSTSFDCSIQYPSTGSAPYPAIIGMNMNTLNVNEILKLGVACITFPADSIGAESGMGSRGTGKFYTIYGSGHSAGSLMAWAWGVDCLIDALETTPAARINPAKLGVTGGSRNGKGALTAGAFCERIALTIPQESGNGGASGWRTADDEKKVRNVQTLGQIIGEQPWFGKALDQFSGQTNKLPHDHHMVMGLCAPRGLLVIENTSMEWLGKQSCYDSSYAARLIFQGLGVKTNMGFSQIGGHEHCQFPASQQPELTAFIKKFLLGDNSANTDVFKTDGGLSFNSSKWVDWSYTLN